MNAPLTKARAGCRLIPTNAITRIVSISRKVVVGIVKRQKEHPPVAAAGKTKVLIDFPRFASYVSPSINQISS